MAFPVGAGLDKLAIGAGLDQNRGRPAVDKLLVRRNSGSGLRELDLINWPSGRGRTAVHKLLMRRNSGSGLRGLDLRVVAIGAGLAQVRGRPAVDKLLMWRNSGSGLRELDLGVGPFRLELAFINWPSGPAGR